MLKVISYFRLFYLTSFLFLFSLTSTLSSDGEQRGNTEMEEKTETESNLD